MFVNSSKELKKIKSEKCDIDYYSSDSWLYKNYSTGSAPTWDHIVGYSFSSGGGIKPSPLNLWQASGQHKYINKIPRADKDQNQT